MSREYTTNSYKGADGRSYATSSEAQHATNIWNYNNKSYSPIVNSYVDSSSNVSSYVSSSSNNYNAINQSINTGNYHVYGSFPIDYKKLAKDKARYYAYWLLCGGISFGFAIGIWIFDAGDKYNHCEKNDYNDCELPRINVIFSVIAMIIFCLIPIIAGIYNIIVFCKKSL